MVMAAALPDAGWQRATAGAGPVSLHSRGRTDMAMPTTEELTDLTHRLRQLGRRAIERHPDSYVITSTSGARAGGRKTTPEAGPTFPRQPLPATSWASVHGWLQVHAMITTFPAPIGL
jgi:hypothetical protein